MHAKNHSTPSTIAVIGLGKIGLPLAAIFAYNGYQVIGADIDQTIVDSINQGLSPYQSEPGLDERITAAYEHHKLSATTNTIEAVSQADMIIVIVPVVTDQENNIDYRAIDLAVQNIAKGLREDALVIFETTLPPGDTVNRFGNKIEHESGLTPGEDFDLVYSPERVYSNQIIHDLRQYPKVIGGINRQSTERAAKFYKTALNCDVFKVSTIETAEFAKIAECVYRDVNIALANELAMFSDNFHVNMQEVITASNSQPYAHIHSPGAGVGGHCIPVYPYFFINQGLNNGLTSQSRQINDNMAVYAIEKMEQNIDYLHGKHILILGLAYRGNVKEVTKSSALKLINQLQQRGALPYVHDPIFSDIEIRQYGAIPFSWEHNESSTVDGIILQAFHQEYKTIDYSYFSNCQIILDGRHQLDEQTITQHGITYISIGNEGGSHIGAHSDA